MRFALIATTEQCGHLFHDARTNCVESRRITTSRATGYAVLQSPLLPRLRTDRPSSNRRVTYPRPSRSIGSMHRRGPSNDHPSSHLCLASRFVLSQLAPFPSRGALLRPTTPLSPSRSLLTDLVSRPFLLQHERTTCCSRAHLRRACVRSLLPCATRAARVLRTKSRVIPPGCLRSPSLHYSDRRLALSLTLSSPCSRSWRTVAAVLVAPRSPVLARVSQLVLRVRHAKYAPPPFYPQPSLSPISLLARLPP